jgi:hypothetical protein
VADFFVTLVDHTEGTKPGFLPHILSIFLDLLLDCFGAGTTTVSGRIGIADGSEDLVIHWVQEVQSSYVKLRLPGANPGANKGGHTHHHGGIVGSEIYRVPHDGGPRHRPPEVFARLAFHEALHNKTGLGNAGLHPHGSLAASPPDPPLTDPVRQLMSNAMANPFQNEKQLT